MRFSNELDYIKNAGGVIVRVNNPNIPSKDEHVSEQGVTSFDVDYEIDNSGSIESLYEKLDKMMEEIG